LHREVEKGRTDRRERENFSRQPDLFDNSGVPENGIGSAGDDFREKPVGGQPGENVNGELRNASLGS
jgi:hypothetical protein